MTVTVNDLVLTVRRKVGDWGAALVVLDDALTADTTDTTVSVVARPDTVSDGQYMECDTEMMEIAEVSTDFTVRRAAKGTTVAAHAIGDLAIVEPRFSNLGILAALVKSQRVLAGYIPYKTVTTTTTIAASTEEYSMPVGAEYVDKVELETSTTGLYRSCSTYEILDEYDPPKIRIPWGSAPTGRTLRLTTLGQYSEFLWDATVSDIPVKYHDFLTGYAAGVLIEEEEGHITDETEQSHGVKAKPGVNQQVGRNLQALAFAHLEAVKPMTRIIHRPDQRVYRR